MFTRRRIVLALGAGALATPLASFAQQPSGNIPRIGLLWIQSSGPSQNIEAFREGMRALGYVDGKNISIDDRSLVENYDGLAIAADRLARERVSLIVTYGTTALQAAYKASPGIPIVMASAADPVKLGFAASLSKPRGNVTGITSINMELSGKRLEVLKDLVPSIRRVAVLLASGSPTEVNSLKNFELAARTLKLEARAVEVRNSDDIESAIAGISRKEVQAIAMVGSTLFTANRKQLVNAIERILMPAIYANSEFVEEGGLVSYGTNAGDQFRRLTIFVDKILKGTKPGDIPIEQPTTFELAVNLKTAKALGIKVPNSILVRATKLIK